MLRKAAIYSTIAHLGSTAIFMGLATVVSVALNSRYLPALQEDFTFTSITLMFGILFVLSYSVRWYISYLFVSKFKAKLSSKKKILTVVFIELFLFLSFAFPAFVARHAVFSLLFITQSNNIQQIIVNWSVVIVENIFHVLLRTGVYYGAIQSLRKFLIIRE